MSKETVSIGLPDGVSRSRELTPRASPEDWGREPDFGGADSMSMGRSDSFYVDLAAERTRFEVLALGAFMPFALGWFWLANVIAGRVRI